VQTSGGIPHMVRAALDHTRLSTPLNCAIGCW
jgi:hypothetical protein